MPPPKRPWFRVYVEMISDLKIKRLSPAHRWLWIVVLACARLSPRPGYLFLTDRAAMTVDDLREAAALPRKAVEQGLTELAHLGLIEQDYQADVWFVPKWNERQYESDDVTKRTAKHRRRNAVSPDDVTPPETETETEDLSSSSSASSGLGSAGDDGDDENLKLYLKNQGHEPEDIEVALHRLRLRREGFGSPISDEAGWADQVATRLADARDMAHGRAETPAAVIDEERYEYVDGVWKVAS